MPKLVRFIISGTIAIEYGIMEGLNFYFKIAENNPHSELKIIGHCANLELLNTLEKLAKNNSKLEVVISKNPIDHAAIAKAIYEADFGLLPYHPNLSIDGKWPTKIFEYMANKLPIIIQENKTWDYYILDNQAGVSIDFLNLETGKLQLIIEKEYYQRPLPADVYWSSQESKLNSVVSKYYTV